MEPGTRSGIFSDESHFVFPCVLHGCSLQMDRHQSCAERMLERLRYGVKSFVGGGECSMPGIAGTIKGRMSRAVELLPYGRDFVLHATRNRRGISYAGVFNTWEDASQAAAKRKSTEYDVINANKAKNSESEKQTLDTWFHDGDYPLLYWLSKIVDERCTVLDLGGSIGHFFYSIQSKLNLPETMKYVIAELPAAVTYGAEIARERKEGRLSFVDSGDLSPLPNFDVLLSAGALQYIPRPFSRILSELSAQPEHILLHNLPVHAEREFFTIQNLGLCEVPYRIHSERALCGEMESRGYTLMAKWVKDRTIEIPFHRDLVISGYAGFYFRRDH